MRTASQTDFLLSVCEFDGRNEKIGYKIREAQVTKIPYMLVIGANEVENGTVSVRSRKDGATTVMTAGDFADAALEEIRTKRI